jgi:hypothetical protein
MDPFIPKLYILCKWLSSALLIHNLLQGHQTKAP